MTKQQDSKGLANSSRTDRYDSSGNPSNSRIPQDFGHFLQSHIWEKYEQLEGEKTFWLEGDGWHALVLLKSTPLGNYLYLPYGPALKDASRLESALVELRHLAKEQKAFFIRIEPTLPLRNKGETTSDEIPCHNEGEKCDNIDQAGAEGSFFTIEDLKKLGLKKSHDIDPANTWVVDLPDNAEVLLNKMEKDRVRRWRNLDKKGIKIRTSKDPEEIVILSSLLKKLSSERQFNPQDENHLKNQLKAEFATLYVAELNGTPVAASLVYDYGDTRFAVHAADDPAYHNLRAGISLTIQKMLDAEAAGKKYYDFWGITTSNNPKHPWYGFTKYKKSYAGRQIDYAGTWDLPLDRAKYAVYQILRKINRIHRRAK